MGVVGDIEIGNDAEHSLLLFVVNLRFGDFDGGECDLHIGDIGSDRQRDSRNEVDFSRRQDSRRGLWGEARRRNGELKSAGSHVGKGKLAVVAGQDLLAWSLGFTSVSISMSASVGSGKFHRGSGDDGSTLIDHRST